MLIRTVFWKLQTCIKLGPVNVLTVFLYRLAKKSGAFRLCFPVMGMIQGPFFTDHAAKPGGMSIVRYFSRHDIEVSSPPDWFCNPWTGARSRDRQFHWSDLPDFDKKLGDIKTVWELSRFDWLPQMAWGYHGGTESALGMLELWLQDWCANNPINGGVNWKCGQEASLRCLNMLVTALLVDNSFENPRKGLLDFLFCHLQRIASTMFYAQAQKNNHGVIEAAALFVAGSYLCKYGRGRQQKYGKKWTKTGRFRLQAQVKKLILRDGSFSQHSTNYHRLMLDVLSLVELLRERLKVQPFEPAYYDRLKSAVVWLHKMVDNKSGDVPNLGANDGAYLFNLKQMEYRDFRPSLQLAAAVFLKKAAWFGSIEHPLLEVFGIELSKLSTIEPSDSFLMHEGGYACLKRKTGFALLRLPMYQFRPSHADGLHLDIWHNGINWIRDAGSFSYNTDDESMRYFPGTTSHSTVCFDGRDQMPRLGRFLFGAWLKADEIIWDAKQERMGSGYTDYLGASHARAICGNSTGWLIVDRVSGFKNEAIMRWHLAPADWDLTGLILCCTQVKISIFSERKISLSLVELPESLYYLQRQNVPVLEVRCQKSCTVETRIEFIQ